MPCMSTHRRKPVSGLTATLLEPDQLRWRCPVESLEFESTAEVEPIQGIVGQDAAVEALQFGLRTNAPGQHVFVRGLSGTGRLTLVRRLLGEFRLECPLAPDRVFVRNFADPGQPELLTLPRASAAKFRDCIAALRDFIENELASSLNTQVVRAEKRRLDREMAEKVSAITGPFDAELGERALALVTLQDGENVRPAIAAVIDGKPVPPDELEALKEAGTISEAKLLEFEEHLRESSERLEEIGHEVRDLQTERDVATGEMYERHARSLLKHQTATIRRQFADEAIGKYLDSIIDDVVSGITDEEPIDVDAYSVNVVKDNSHAASCPVVVENIPSLDRLVGSIEVPPKVESSSASHMWIRPGALLEADGGYLILEAKEVLTQPNAWKALMRTLRSGLLEVVPPESGRSGSAFLKPDAIPVSLKVILVGDANVHAALNELDDDFAALFKVIADFDSTIPRDEQSLQYYAGILSRIAGEEKLPPFARAAVAALIEHGARIAGHVDRLTARFARLADIAREAAFLTVEAGRELVTADDVKTAIQRTKRRANLPARKFRELVAKGSIHIETRDRTVGQINGLAVIQAGPLTYGFPARITATASPGTGGAINIERESDLSGAIHTKGFFILGGLLRRLLRTEHPLSFEASIAFEQSYGGIDGDSASGAEICCLLSALTEIPIRQDLAMTGAIDQVGNILPIGAATEKIEGFFDTCVDAGLSGTQGVIIPQANVGDLMLRDDVVQACRDGKFHVYAASTIHAAIGLFSGMEPGEVDAKTGYYPPDTFLGQAVTTARRFWDRIHREAEPRARS